MEKLINTIQEYSNKYHNAVAERSCYCGRCQGCKDISLAMLKLTNKLIAYERELFDLCNKDILATAELIRNASKMPVTEHGIKGREPIGMLPSGTYIDNSNYFNVEIEKLTRKREKLPLRYQSIVTFKADGTRARTTKIELQAFGDWLMRQERGLKRKKLTSTPYLARTIKKRIRYVNFKQLDKVNRYFQDNSIAELSYSDVKNRVSCNKCNKINSLRTLECGLACSRCGHFSLKNEPYQVFYWYVNVLTRYVVSTLKGVVTKQLEVEGRWKKLYSGRLG